MTDPASTPLVLVTGPEEFLVDRAALPPTSEVLRASTTRRRSSETS